MVKLLFKYGFVTVVSQVFLIAGTYVSVDIFNISSSISYFFVISFMYVGVYIANTKYVFVTKFSNKNIIKYVVYLSFFWAFNNVLFNVLTLVFDFEYLVAIVINILVFGAIRFFVQKKYVFNE